MHDDDNNTHPRGIFRRIPWIVGVCAVWSLASAVWISWIIAHRVPIKPGTAFNYPDLGLGSLPLLLVLLPTHYLAALIALLGGCIDAVKPWLATRERLTATGFACVAIIALAIVPLAKYFLSPTGY